MPDTLVLGIGNSLLSDEGVGIHVIRRVEAELSGRETGVRIIDGGTLSFTLAGDIESAERLIVVDAAELGEAPGSVRVFVDAEMDHFIGTAKRSVHEVGLMDLLDIARLTESLPRERALVAIQPVDLTWGSELSPSVADALPLATEEVHRLIRDWRTETTDTRQYVNV